MKKDFLLLSLCCFTITTNAFCMEGDGFTYASDPDDEDNDSLLIDISRPDSPLQLSPQKPSSPLVPAVVAAASQQHTPQNSPKSLSSISLVLASQSASSSVSLRSALSNSGLQQDSPIAPHSPARRGSSPALLLRQRTPTPPASPKDDAASVELAVQQNGQNILESAIKRVSYQSDDGKLRDQLSISQRRGARTPLPPKGPAVVAAAASINASDDSQRTPCCGGWLFPCWWSR